MEINYTLEQLTSLVGQHQSEGALQEQNITGIATLTEAQPGDLSFLGNKKYKRQVPDSKASIILLPEDFEGSPAPSQVFIRVANPSLALARICADIEQSLWPKPDPGIHPTAYVHETAVVHPTATVGALCVIEAGATVGEGTQLEAQCHIGRHTVIGAQCCFKPGVQLLDYCQTGDRVRLHSGVVLGSDGFGYEQTDKGLEKVPQIGRVIIGNDVEIGANTTIDRGRFGDTTIGNGTKIDNLVQIGHNARIGNYCIIVAQTGISGSTVVEDAVVLGGQVGIGGHVTIGKGSMVGAQSGIDFDVAEGSYIRGTPAYPYMLAHKIDILKKRLPDLFKRVASIEDIMKAQGISQENNSTS